MYDGKQVAGLYHINHMEKSLGNPDTLLYSDGSALLRFNFTSQQPGTKGDVIAGWSSTHGYSNADGTNAQFYYITGFVQLNQWHVVVAVDHSNHCLRWIDTLSGRVQHFAGGGQGFADGDRLSTAKFNYPHKIIIMRGYFYTTDQFNSAIRLLDVNEMMVETVIKNSSKVPYPSGFIADSAQRYLYVTIQHGIIRIDPNTGEYIPIAGATKTGWVDGDFTLARFNYPAEVVFTTNDVLIVADDRNNRLRILNLKTRTVSSVCSGEFKQVLGADGMDCSLKNPRSLLFTGTSLYAGEWTAIRRSKITYSNSIENSFG